MYLPDYVTLSVKLHFAKMKDHVSQVTCDVMSVIHHESCKMSNMAQVSWPSLITHKFFHLSIFFVYFEYRPSLLMIKKADREKKSTVTLINDAPWVQNPKTEMYAILNLLKIFQWFQPHFFVSFLTISKHCISQWYMPMDASTSLWWFVSTFHWLP